jgi:multisubunit Na+/H+ antiporter MnhB subunit
MRLLLAAVPILIVVLASGFLAYVMIIGWYEKNKHCWKTKVWDFCRVVLWLVSILVFTGWFIWGMDYVVKGIK